ncbi:MAG: PEGA domain-containing protein [Verrucomicrobia bacterium]|nr:PEGA domain-containing protein [Verrucomicrobiota bacterium]
METASPKPIQVALFVDNRAGASFDDKVPVLENFLAGRLASGDMEVLSRQVILNALKDFGAGSTSAPNTPGQELDRVLSDSGSALRLAQNLGADYILLAALASYGMESRNFTGEGVNTINQTHTLRATYRLAEAARGGEVAGDTVVARRTLRQSAGLQIESSDVLNGLLDDAADQIAASLLARRVALPEVSLDASRVNVTFQCSITDFARLPNAGLNENNEVVLGEGSARATVSEVTVEINGITVGSTPGPLEVPPGLNKLRLTREGFKPFERTVNFYQGQTLTVALQMTEAGFARWKDVVAAYTALENNRKLTDAEVEVLRGYAQMLRQSGIKVDTKEGLKFYHGLYW